MTIARNLLASLLILCATVLCGLWLPGVWLQGNVVDQDGFLAITDQLSDDTEFQRVLSDSAVEEVLDDDRVPGWVREQLTPLFEEQAEKLTRTAVYGTLWEQSMGSLHTALFTPGESVLEVDLDPVIDQLLAALEEHLPVDLPRPEDVTLPLATIPDVPLLNALGRAAPWAPWCGPAALVLFALALILGADRRALLAAAGLGIVLAGACVWLVSAQSGVLVPDSVDQEAFLGPIVQEFQGRFAQDMAPYGAMLLGLGALVLTAGALSMGVRRR